MESTDCNLCNSDESKLIGNVHDTAFNNPGVFPIVKCQRCGLIYLRDRPAPDEMIHYYPSEYKPYRKAIQDEPSKLMRWARRRNIQKKRKILDNYTPKIPGSILDVGCSTGIFLDEMQQAGWQTFGIEINPDAIEYARHRFGLEIFQGTLISSNFTPDSFDVITFWDVIEHTYNPLETLQYANKILNGEGVIVLTLPNWESLDRKLFGLSWIGYDAPRHLFVFPERPLAEMLNKAGFKIIKNYSGLGGYYTFLASLNLWLNENFPVFAKYLLAILEYPGVRYPFQPIFSVLDWFGLGGTRVVIARKVSK